jgi:hypothetical protein
MELSQNFMNYQSMIESDISINIRPFMEFLSILFVVMIILTGMIDGSMIGLFVMKNSSFSCLESSNCFGGAFHQYRSVEDKN